jgi:aminocarboxymuconate-semialdehyde decarboxylase
MERFKMIIDSHAHFVPPSLLDAIRKQTASFPSVRLIEQDGSTAFSFSGRKATRPVSPQLTDLADRFNWMRAEGIDRQVVSGWLDMFGYEMPAEEGERWSHLANEQLLAATSRDQRLIPVATVPLQDGSRAAGVLRQAHELGFRAAMIGTQPKGVGGVLDDPSLDPFWRMADELGTALFVHPAFESGDPRVQDYGMANAIGRVTDALIAVSRIIFSGHVLRYRNAKIIVGIGGAALPYVLGRMRRNYMLDRNNLHDPDASLAALYYDTILHDARTLRFLAETVGADRLMLGSDRPFPIGDPTPTTVVRDAKLSATDTASILGGLAEKLFSA